MILTNGRVWAIYHVTSPAGAPIETSLLMQVDLLDESTVNAKAAQLFYLHKSAMRHDKITELWHQRAATAPSALVDVLLSDSVLDELRKEVRRRSGYNPELSALAATLKESVIRPETQRPR